MVIQQKIQQFLFRFKYFVALSDVSCKDWPKGGAVDHILFKGTYKQN